MLEFVEELLRTHDNIIDQLLALKENKNHKEVKKYIRALLRTNLSPYFKYCIDKYYFDKDVEEVKIPTPKLHDRYVASEWILKLIEKEDNIINQLKILKKYKGNKEVDDFVRDNIKYSDSDYHKYCIKKYFYGLNVPVVKPTAKSLRIRLFNIEFPILIRWQYFKEDIKAARENKKHKKEFKRVSPGDTIEILEGPFRGFIGKVDMVDKKNLKIIVIVELFGDDTSLELECTDKFRILGRKNNKKRL